MDDNRVSTLLTALKLDDHPLINQFMFVEELNYGDGSFILSALIKYQIEKNRNVILVMCHNSFGHFHSIGLKLGYNLASLKESGQIYILDVLEKIRSEGFLASAKPLKTLFGDIKQQVDAWKSEKGVCVIVENIGNFLLVETEENAEELFTFINYLRAIALEEKNSSVVLSLHNFPNSSSFYKTAKSIRHLADVTVVLSDLQTGRASDVTGHLTVIRKEKKFRKSTSEYQYELQDKSIRVFTPGSRNFI